MLKFKKTFTHPVRSFDWQAAWLNLQYQKTPLSTRLNHEYVSMLFHIHSPWSCVCLGPCHVRVTHTHIQPTYRIWKRLANYTAFCQSLRKALCSLVGIWPHEFPVVFFCRMWWRELCPMVVVLARVPLTRWLKRWNMLIKPKTTSTHLHQAVTLVVSGATVRFICCETRTCRHACMSVYLCLCVSNYIFVWSVLSGSVSYVACIIMLLFVNNWQELSFKECMCDSLWINFISVINHICMP